MKNTVNKLQAIGAKLVARQNCNDTENWEWMHKHEERIEAIMETAPSGSGFDAGTSIDWDTSDASKITFKTSFHHMDDMGGYDGWTEHDVIFTPSFCNEYDCDITGDDRNGILDYIAEVFTLWIEEKVELY